jgi:hypothetical protein
MKNYDLADGWEDLQGRISDDLTLREAGYDGLALAGLVRRLREEEITSRIWQGHAIRHEAAAARARAQLRALVRSGQRLDLLERAAWLLAGLVVGLALAWLGGRL